MSEKKRRVLPEEQKERKREYARVYMREYVQRPKVKERVRRYREEYLSRPGVRERIKLTEYARAEAKDRGVSMKDVLREMGHD
jgi:hypothetical protein